MYCNPDITIN